MAGSERSALLTGVMLAGALTACGAPATDPAPVDTIGEAQAVEEARAMLSEQSAPGGAAPEELADDTAPAMGPAKPAP